MTIDDVINLHYYFQFADRPLKVYKDLSKSELMRELKESRLKVIHSKSHQQKISQLNHFIRSNHPLNKFLESLDKEELNSLYKYYDIKGKNIKILYLSNKIFSVSPQNPIQAAVTFRKASPPAKSAPC